MFTYLKRDDYKTSGTSILNGPVKSVINATVGVEFNVYIGFFRMIFFNSEYQRKFRVCGLAYAKSCMRLIAGGC